MSSNAVATNDGNGSSNDTPRASAGGASAAEEKSAMRQRRTGKAATAARNNTDATPAAATANANAAGSENAASLVHAHQGRAQSSAHICSNTAGCPLIAAWEAAEPGAARDAVPLSEELLACAACRSVLYCSRDCQRMHWLEGGHKQECPKLLAKNYPEEAEAAAAARAGGQAAAASPAASSSSSAAAAGPAAPHRRNYALDISVAFGPRTIICLLLILYLVYRVYGPHSSSRAATGAGSDDTPPAVS